VIGGSRWTSCLRVWWVGLGLSVMVIDDGSNGVGNVSVKG
jgi:hypothetical protein